MAYNPLTYRPITVHESSVEALPQVYVLLSVHKNPSAVAASAKADHAVPSGMLWFAVAAEAQGSVRQ